MALWVKVFPLLFFFFFFLKDLATHVAVNVAEGVTWQGQSHGPGFQEVQHGGSEVVGEGL